MYQLRFFRLIIFDFVMLILLKKFYYQKKSGTSNEMKAIIAFYKQTRKLLNYIKLY